jgi:hypothetical protein
MRVRFDPDLARRGLAHAEVLGVEVPSFYREFYKAVGVDLRFYSDCPKRKPPGGFHHPYAKGAQQGVFYDGPRQEQWVVARAFYPQAPDVYANGDWDLLHEIGHLVAAHTTGRRDLINFGAEVEFFLLDDELDACRVQMYLGAVVLGYSASQTAEVASHLNWADTPERICDTFDAGRDFYEILRQSYPGLPAFPRVREEYMDEIARAWVRMEYMAQDVQADHQLSWEEP